VGVSLAASKTDSNAAEKRHRRLLSVSAVVLIAILVVAGVTVALLFLPIRQVNVSRQFEVPHRAGIDTLNLTLDASISQVDLLSENETDQLFVLNASMTGWASLLASEGLFQVSFNYSYTNSVLMVTSTIGSQLRWLVPLTLSVTCNLRVNPALKMNLNVKTDFGRTVINTKAGVVLNSLNLETTTGGVEVNLSEGTVVKGNISLTTVTGGIDFSWNNVVVDRDIAVSTKVTTGGTKVSVNQTTPLFANVALNAEATTGGVNLDLKITNGVAAKIDSGSTVGGIDATVNGFSGNRTPLQSLNYPAVHNFNVRLGTTTGRINVNADYTP
jgi:hypothetical protein